MVSFNGRIRLAAEFGDGSGWMSNEVLDAVRGLLPGIAERPGPWTRRAASPPRPSAS